MATDLIVMLTHNDKTVTDAAEIFEACKNAPCDNWGFKEVGLPLNEMKALRKAMSDSGKTTFLEVVAYTEAECLEGTKMAAECGFDVLMGTMFFDSVNDYCKAHGLKYMPFVGKITGRPSILEGTIPEIIDEANRLIRDKKIHGIDLLGYRYTGDAVKLNAEFIKNVNAPVCLAGSVSSFQRLDEVKATGAWAFTIGSAFFEKKFGDTSFAEQIKIVVDYMKN